MATTCGSGSCHPVPARLAEPRAACAQLDRACPARDRVARRGNSGALRPPWLPRHSERPPPCLSGFQAGHQRRLRHRLGCVNSWVSFERRGRRSQAPLEARLTVRWPITKRLERGLDALLLSEASIDATEL